MKPLIPSSPALVVTWDLSAEENYSGQALAKGQIVYRYRGCTYGCIPPDGEAVTFEPDITPFFEVPADALANHETEQTA